MLFLFLSTRTPLNSVVAFSVNPMHLQYIKCSHICSSILEFEIIVFSDQNCILVQRTLLVAANPRISNKEVTVRELRRLLEAGIDCSILSGRVAYTTS